MKFLSMAVALIAFTPALTPLGAASAEPRASRGELLYRGRIVLKARMANSVDDLAPVATRCSNCHGPDARGVAEAGVNGSSIRGASLTRSQSRRGGPASAYTAATFRDALRSGHDPAGVLLARAMPRYAIPDSDCAALWEYLLSLGL